MDTDRAKLALCVYQLILAMWNLMASYVLKSVEGQFTVSDFLFLRQLFTATILWVISASVEVVNFNKISQRTKIKLFFCGLFGCFVTQHAYVFGLMLTSPTAISLFDGPLTPIAVFLLALLIGLEHAGRTMKDFFQQFLPIIATVSGAALVLMGVSQGLDESEVTVNSRDTQYKLYGIPLLFVECLSMATTIILQKLLLNAVPQYFLVAVMYSVGTISCAVFILLVERKSLLVLLTAAFIELTVNPPFLLGLIYSVLIHSVLAMITFNYGAKRLEASKGEFFIALLLIKVD